MARMRMLKPGFFKNEHLAALPIPARLLFAGLWTIADREGRLEDRPARIKAEVLPYDRVNCDRLLGLLADGGFIERYSVGDINIIQITAFAKHQNPHIKEPASTLPTQCENGASTVLVPVSHQPSPAESLTESESLTETESFDPPLPPASGGLDRAVLRIGRARNGSRRQRDIQALEAQGGSRYTSGKYGAVVAARLEAEG